MDGKSLNHSPFGSLGWQMGTGLPAENHSKYKESWAEQRVPCPDPVCHSHCSWVLEPQLHHGAGGLLLFVSTSKLKIK